ncbi:cyclic nucleotide-binding domain-containing protein [Paractinoplanes hotanensis]|uniref:Cyclic nucleotide-binding domain-containing protein n=1 Tax=Paractinoplanes hotanensis TaxID=2906497 RepID=A0ABT0XQM3_9ACTN|nr:cyclic nucleotide-binding domain-containing protein [Actinoplanes hotanensis]MCM4076078.1 cyclic nucleotide-binding domain-containing protein [Actinoplanes hotanensis]
MSSGRNEDLHEVLVVSCDIVGHSSELVHDVQLDRVVGLNTVVAETIEDRSDAIWASGGDGGHVVFPEGDDRGAAQAALDLVTRFLTWSATAGVGLRIVAHAGRVSLVRGADGRVQVVGNGINVAGWMLARGGPDGVIVSEAFRRRLERHGEWAGIAFHEPRTLRDKRGVDQLLLRMSVQDLPSAWYSPIEGDRQQLRAALALRRSDPAWSHRGWEIMYFAKRILQVNKSDREALDAIGTIKKLQLMYTTPDGDEDTNPFFEYLDPTMLREVVLSAQLVERQYNEVICRGGDEGDTMFVILRGRVGVYKTHGEDDTRPIEPHFSHQEGDVVGELALALGRNRTADLVALTPVVLLSFHYQDIMKHLESLTGNQAAGWAREAIEGFISRRVLEYISQDVDFLYGRDGAGPLASAQGGDPIATLSNYAERIELPDNMRQITFDDAVAAARTPGARHGIYVLADGTLQSRADPGFTLGGLTFPMLWIDLPGFLTLPRHQFGRGSDKVKVFRIAAGGIEQLERTVREKLRRSLLAAAARSCFVYGVFISYTEHDVGDAAAWEQALKERGFRVFMDRPQSGAEFGETVANGLKHSLALVPMITSNVQIRDPEDNWVMREITARRAYFPLEPQIFPVVFGAARPERIAPGVTPIRVGSNAAEAVDQLAQRLEALRSGLLPPPHGETEIIDLPLE